MIANFIVLLVNGLTLALALDLLILILWLDPRNEENFFFALFLFMVVVWATGSLIGRVGAYAGASHGTIEFGLRLLDVGFAGAGICAYIYTAVLIGYRGAFFRLAAFAVLTVIAVYQVLLGILNVPHSFVVTDDGILDYSFDAPGMVLYLAFQLGTAFLVWQNRRKIRSKLLSSSLVMFVFGQMIGLLIPRARMFGISEDISSAAVVLISYAVVQQQIMTPLLGRGRQLEAVRDVSLAVTSRLRLQDTLSAIAAQAVELLSADSAAIFLKRAGTLRLEAVHSLDESLVHHELEMGQGVVGTVAVEQRGRLVSYYYREWRGELDLPISRDELGSVACVPLLFADEVVGVLMVMHNRYGGLFNRDDMHLLELLGPQAAVAITNSRLFEAERQLSLDVALAKDQLEVVLTSTENPVIAVDRQFECIFINPAALKLLELSSNPEGQVVTSFIPAHLLPPGWMQAGRDLRKRGVHVYEVLSADRAYLCHVAALGKQRPEGWVVVANDVTQLKEVDRLKSQMIRMTSHDLKNPLQAAMSYLELLIDDGEDVFTDAMRSDADMVWMQLNRMYRMINGILNLERAESGPSNFEACALEDMLGRVVLDVADQARRKGLILKLDIKESLPLVMGDLHQLSQVFANLVENAVKFSVEGDHVLVCAATSGRQIEVMVEDTGVGIPDDEQQFVFERFYRGRQGVTRSDGTGLGLSLVKSIVERHNGSIKLESKVGEGTTVHVFLPVSSEGDPVDW